MTIIRPQAPSRLWLLRLSSLPCEPLQLTGDLGHCSKLAIGILSTSSIANFCYSFDLKQGH